MPMYEFKCGDCGEQFYVRASFSDKDKGLNPNCPRCGSENTGRVFSSTAFFTRSRATAFTPPAGGSCCSAPVTRR